MAAWAYRSVIDDEVLVERGLFGLIDDDRSPSGAPGWLGLGVPDIVAAGLNAVVFHSGGTDHYPAVRLESWLAEPVERDGEWDAVCVEELSLSSGVVRLVAMTARSSDRLFEAGPPGRYRLRVWCRGRADAARASLLRYGFEHGVERWVVQLWPVGT